MGFGLIAGIAGGILGALGSKGKKQTTRFDRDVEATQESTARTTAERESAAEARAFERAEREELARRLGEQRALTATEQVSRLFGPQEEAARLYFERELPGLFGAEVVAPLAPEQALGRALMAGTALGQLGQAPALGQALSVALGAPDVQQNPYFQSALAAAIDPVVRAFTTQVLPALRSTALGMGQQGSSRQALAEALATEALGRQLLNTTAQMASGAYGQGLQAMLRGLSLAPTVQAAQLAPGQTLEGVGALQRALAQEQLLAPFQRAQMLRGLILGDFGRRVAGTSEQTALSRQIAEALGSTVGTSQRTATERSQATQETTAQSRATERARGTETTKTPGTNPLLGALGGFLQGATLGGLLSGGAASALGGGGLLSTIRPSGVNPWTGELIRSRTGLLGGGV